MNSVEQHDCEYLSVAELAAGVSERTSRGAFQQLFGMGPVRYLKLRRLNQVHRLFQNADSLATTVSRIAAQYGLWEFGRFAQDYRLPFDEIPPIPYAVSGRVRPKLSAEPLRVRPEECPYSPWSI